MLTSFEIENFKAFGSPTRIDFAPITLVFGENSAGKSSLLQSLNLLKQTRESREHGSLLLPRSETGIVDLGSFQELLFDHDTSRVLRFRFDLQLSRRGRYSDVFYPTEDATLGYEIAFSRVPQDNEVTLSYLKIHLANSSEDGLIAKYEPRQLDPDEQRMLRPPPYLMWRTRRPSRGYKLQGAECTEITCKPVFWQRVFQSWKENSEQVITAIKMLRDEAYGKRMSAQLSLFQEENDLKRSFNDAERFYGTDFTIEQFVERARRAELGSLVAMDGFVPIPARMDKTATCPEFEAMRHYARYERSRDIAFFDSTVMLSDVGRELEDVLESLFPMGPYRQAPKRLYIFTGTTPRDVGYSGDLLPDLLFRRKDLVDETNCWLERLEIGYRIEIKPVGTRSNDLFEVRLLDTRRKRPVDVAISDVGFGISQLLPFVVQSLASERQIITIEQPEVHVHPRLQADLGDLLIAAIQEPRSHRFIVETHSEHLILRLLRRIRETSSNELPENHPGLRPEDLSVIYLERSESGTVAHHLKVDEDGEFVDRWPKGFFAERAEELF